MFYKSLCLFYKTENRFYKTLDIGYKNKDIGAKRLLIATKSLWMLAKSTDTFYKTVIKIILPLLCGLNIQFITDDNQKSENNIEILEEEKNKATIHYRKNKYIVQNHNVDTYLLRVEDNLLKKENKKESPNFVLIRSNKREKIKNDRKSLTI